MSDNTNSPKKDNGFPWWKCQCGWIGRSDSTAIVHIVVSFEGKEMTNEVTHQCPMCKAIGKFRNTENPFVDELSVLFGDDKED